MPSNGDLSGDPCAWSGTGLVTARFAAMASPCELLFDGTTPAAVRGLGEAMRAETARIEAKWSRYRPDSPLARINRAAGGGAVTVDDETAQLLDYADACFRLSGGLFDPTCGVLRRIWRFDAATGEPPDQAAVDALLPLIGWQRVSWRRPAITLPAGMELDLGGLGKEYAVDRCLGLARAAGLVHVLVNFGGDLAVAGPRADGGPWQVGSWDDLAGDPAGGPRWELRSGAIATSGSTRRFLLHQGRRYGHILDPRRGRPVVDAPLSVSVAAPTCSQAGLLSTLAMLQGAGAESFLRDQGVRFRCLRDGGVESAG